uniref:Endonuclease/exonuclease/phosphatase domain-containing protein n=1 Tax=Biomphalaria glabrata TaxID=6526 RepID=A0A2C9LSL5_BIOGL
MSRPELSLVSTDLRSQSRVDVLNDVGSDHLPVLVTIELEKLNVSTPYTEPKWVYKRANWDLFRSASDVALNGLDIQADCINRTYGLFVETILGAARKAITRSYGGRKFRHFWSHDLARLIRLRRAARRQHSRRKTDKTRRAYNKLTAEVKEAIAEGTRQKWAKTCANLDLADGRQAWKLLNNLTRAKEPKTAAPLQTAQGLVVTDSKRSDALNHAFATISRTGERSEVSKALDSIRKAKAKRSYVYGEDETSTFITYGELDITLRKCKLRKAPGPDGISNEMLKHLGPIGRRKLLDLINRTWTKGDFPKAWGVATIVSLLKKGKVPDRAESYRPVSLTSNVGKAAERMVNRRHT